MSTAISAHSNPISPTTPPPGNEGTLQLNSEGRLDLLTLPPSYKSLVESIARFAASGTDAIVLSLKGNHSAAHRGMHTFLVDGVMKDPRFSEYTLCMPTRYFALQADHQHDFEERILEPSSTNTLERLYEALITHTQRSGDERLNEKKIILVPENFWNDRFSKESFRDRLGRAYGDKARIIASNIHSYPSFEGTLERALVSAVNDQEAARILIEANPLLEKGSLLRGKYNEEFHRGNVERFGNAYLHALRLFYFALSSPYPLRIVIAGDQGTGKTTLLKAMARAAAHCGRSYEYQSLAGSGEATTLEKERSESCNPGGRHFVFVDQLDKVEDLQEDDRPTFDPYQALHPAERSEEQLSRFGHLIATSNTPLDTLIDEGPQSGGENPDPLGLLVGYNEIPPGIVHLPQEASRITPFAGPFSAFSELDNQMQGIEIDWSGRCWTDGMLAEL